MSWIAIFSIAGLGMLIGVPVGAVVAVKLINRSMENAFMRGLGW